MKILMIFAAFISLQISASEVPDWKLLPNQTPVNSGNLNERCFVRVVIDRETVTISLNENGNPVISDNRRVRRVERTDIWFDYCGDDTGETAELELRAKGNEQQYQSLRYTLQDRIKRLSTR